MNQNLIQILETLKKLDDGEAVEIRKVKGNLEVSKAIHPIVEKNFVSQQDFRSTSIVSVSTNQFEHYRDFGKKPVEENLMEREFVIAIFQQLILTNPDSVETGTAKINSLKYTTKSIDGMTGFYNMDGTLRFVKSDGLEYWTGNKE